MPQHGVKRQRIGHYSKKGQMSIENISSDESAISQALYQVADILKIPPRRTAAQWANENRVLPEGTDQSGAWKTPPEWIEIYEAAGLTGDGKKYRYVILPCPSQSGKTELLLNIAGHRLDDGPRVPILYIGPTEDMTKDLVRDRVDKFLRSTPSLWDNTARGQAYAVLQKWIKGIPWSFGWSGSAAQLASRPVGLVMLDELDRMPTDVGNEGSPFELALARTKRYQQGKVLCVSSPTIWGSSPIWDRFEQGTMHMFSWRCASCDEYFVPTKENLLYDDTGDADLAYQTATIACHHCGQEYTDEDKNKLNENGKYIRHRKLEDEETAKNSVFDRYVPDEDQTQRISASYWFSGLVPLFTSIKTLAYKLHSANLGGDPSVVQSVVNTWFGEPWAESGDAPSLEEVMHNVADYSPENVVFGIQKITCGVDVQKNGLYYVVRGWGYNSESWLISYGYIAGETAYDNVWMRLQRFLEQGIDGKKIDLTLVDSGYRPQFDDRPRPDHIVYSFCRRVKSVNVHAAKGRDGGEVPVRVRHIDYTHGGVVIKGGVRLYLTDVTSIKRWIHQRLNWPPDQPGRFNLHKETDNKYAMQLLAEEEARKPNGQVYFMKIRRENHYLDCEAYARAAAMSLRVDELKEIKKPLNASKSTQKTENKQNRERFDRRSLF